MYKKNKKDINILIVLCIIFVCVLTSTFFIYRNSNLKGFFARDSIIGLSKIINFPNKENESLMKEIEELKNYKYENEELKKEINDLKSTLEMNKLLSDKEYISASVVNRNLGYWNEKLTIDKGISSGIDNKMAVVSNGTMIGITSNVSQFSSDVLLLCNVKFPMNISVKINIGDSEVYGILNSYNNNSYDIIGVVENIDIKEGATVTTTGLGNIFPSGLYIGTVTDVVTDNFDLSKVVHVKPGTNFDDIKYVSVVKRKES